MNITYDDQDPFGPRNKPKQVNAAAIGQKQIILGTVPSKSNGYKIITFKSKTGKSHASLAKTQVLKKYEESFFIQCNNYRNANIDGYFEFELDVYYPNQRSDLDGCLKVILDCLQKIKAFANDNKCTRLVLNKFVDKSNPRVEFTIKKAMENG
jgi:Holliday junction resolvase RusA-like endonuclease